MSAPQQPLFPGSADKRSAGLFRGGSRWIGNRSVADDVRGFEMLPNWPAAHCIERGLDIADVLHTTGPADGYGLCEVVHFTPE